METLTSKVTSWLTDNGASLVGISNVERFNGAPKGHHPRDFLPKAQTVVTFGVALLRQALYWEGHMIDSELVPFEHRQDVLQNYFYRQTGYVLVNNLLNMMALRVANLLESHGHLSIFFPATYGTGAILEYIKARIPSAKGLLSQRHAAVRAGLGEFGLNNVVVTSEYGPRIRFNSVITEANLISSQLIEKKVCLGEDCSICLKECPGAISLRSDFDPKAVWYDTPAQTNIDYCINCWDREYCWGRCIRVCPVAQKQLKS